VQGRDWRDRLGTTNARQFPASRSASVRTRRGTMSGTSEPFCSSPAQIRSPRLLFSPGCPVGHGSPSDRELLVPTRSPFPPRLWVCQRPRLSTLLPPTSNSDTTLPSALASIPVSAKQRRVLPLSPPSDVWTLSAWNSGDGTRMSPLQWRFDTTTLSRGRWCHSKRRLTICHSSGTGWALANGCYAGGNGVCIYSLEKA
jgi:hypothetical protein